MRNSLYEQALQRQGVDFEYVEGIALDDINQTRGQQLQARLEPVDHSLTDEYMLMLEQGSEPPPLLLNRPGRGKYIPLDGNQRIFAMSHVAKKHQRPFSAYVVNSDDPMIVDRLCWQFNNAVNGRRLSYGESLAHAVSYVRKYNHPEKAAASLFGVKPWELHAKVREEEIRDIARKHRVDVDRVNQATLLELSTLEQLGEDVLVKAAKAVAESGVNQAETRKLTKVVKEARTHEAKLKAVEQFEECEPVKRSKAETMGGRQKPKPGRKPRAMLQQEIDRLNRLLETFKDDALRPVKEDREEYFQRATKVCNRLILLYGLGTLLNGQGVAS